MVLSPSPPPALLAGSVAAVVLGLFVTLAYWLGGKKMCRGSHAGELCPPIRAILARPEDILYHRPPLNIRPLVGASFKWRVWLSFTRFGNAFIVPLVRRNSELDAFNGMYIPESPTMNPSPDTPPSLVDHAHSNEDVLSVLVDEEVQKVKDEEVKFRLPTVADYIRAYRSRKTTPTDVAKALLVAIADSDIATPPLRAVVDLCRPVVLAMAEASTQRWQQGRTLSMVDGVPVVVKGDQRVEPYPLLCGAVFVSRLADGLPESAVVQKLRDAGAMLIGVANMQELTCGVLGSNPNPHHLTPMNPHHAHRGSWSGGRRPSCCCYYFPGGSSSGSAVSVATGFCPIAVGSDAGGSIRIPAACCGVVGLKPTHLSINTSGSLPLAYTLSVTGPICSSITDAAIALNLFCKEKDREEGEGEKVWLSLSDLGKTGLNGLKVGIYWEYFQDADTDVVDCCMLALDRLQVLGARLVEVKIPELRECAVAHYVTAVSELHSALSWELDEHRRELNAETLSVFSMADHITALEYVNAQKQRTRAVESLRHIFQDQKVDVIVTPATACPAPPIPPGAIMHGCSDVQSSMALARFSFLANLTGVPALVMPVGYTASGLPVGVQLMGAWHQEALLLRIGWALEQTRAFPSKKPNIFYDLIKMAQGKKYGCYGPHAE